MEKKRHYIFTNKKHSAKGIMAAILGTISLVSLGLAIFWTYQARGQATAGMGMVGFTATCFSLTGMVLGYLGLLETDRFHLFAWTGLLLNGLGLGVISMILYAGAYGIGG